MSFVSWEFWVWSGVCSKFSFCYVQLEVQWEQFLQGLLGGETWDEYPCKCFLEPELLWDGGVWNCRAIGNGISACRPELHPPGVF